MARRRLVIGIMFALVGLLATPLARAQRPQRGQPNTPQAPIEGFPKWSTNTYAAKFICGVQLNGALSADPDVQAGRYSTKINVHNNTGGPFTFRKKFIWLRKTLPVPYVGEQPAVPETIVDPEVLREDEAMEVVCQDIYIALNKKPVPPDPWPYVEGFVIMEVYYQKGVPKAPPDPLDVEGIYTYRGDIPNNTTVINQGVSIAVVVYPAKNNTHILH